MDLTVKGLPLEMSDLPHPRSDHAHYTDHAHHTDNFLLHSELASLISSLSSTSFYVETVAALNLSFLPLEDAGHRWMNEKEV